MSFKEFVPTNQLREGFSRHDEDNQLPHVNYASKNYVEPTFYQPSIGTEEIRSKEDHYLGYDDATVGRQNSLRNEEEQYMEDDDVTLGRQSGMNLSAASWLPPKAFHQTSSNSPQGDQLGKPVGEQKMGYFHEESPQIDGSYIEPMVEIFWNGNSYFVPESTAYMYDEQMGYPQSLEVCKYLTSPHLNDFKCHFADMNSFGFDG